VDLEFTHHGPIVAEDSSGRAFAIRFVGSEPGTAGYLAQISINRASDWASFTRAAYRWKLPTENLLYADVDGNIGWIATGLDPIRSWSGLLPVPGDGRYEWEGFLPFSKLPQTLNPESGIIATANHNILPQGYAEDLNSEWATPYRYDRIIDVLSSRGAWTRQGFERLQHDEFSIPASRLVPVLLAAADRRGLAGEELRQLRSWDYVMRRDNVAPAIYEAWLKAVRPLVYTRQLGPGMARDLPWDLPTVMRLLTEPAAAFSPAARDSIVLTALSEATATLRQELGPDAAAWRYGRVHVAPFRHPLSGAYDLDAAPRGGDGSTVNMTGGAGWLQTHGASYRGIFDLADWDNSVATTVPGQSGQPGSPYYDNLLRPWTNGEYFPLAYTRAAVERVTAHVLWLDPRR
jgi:penicillin amidase